MAKKTYSVLREFDAENEPTMKGHELIVFNHVVEAGEIERTDLVAALQAGVDAGDFESKQDVSGMLSFQMGNLKKRGLIKEVVEKTESTARARKTTLTIKVLVRTRDFDEENEPKMGKAESWVFDQISAEGVRRPDLVAMVENGDFETAQKPSGFISFHVGNLQKRGLVRVDSQEEPKPEAQAEAA